MNKHTTDKTRVQAIPRINIPHYASVKYLQMGERHAEVLYMEKKPKIGIRKISKTHYEVIATKEIKAFAQADGKAVENIKKSMRRVEQLIKANFDTVGNADNALFVTLTYEGGNMTDKERLFKDFDRFMVRLKREYKGHKLDYIAVAEPHASGGWHMHMLLKSDQPKLYIDNNEKMQPLWRQGFTKTVRLKSDDCGSYYTAYFSNVEAPVGEPDPDPNAEYAFAGDEESGKQKRFKKGDRLRFYPKYFKFYRCSRGIIRPDPKDIKYSEVPKNLGKPKRSRTYAVTKDFKKYDMDTVSLETKTIGLNLIQREIYKKL